MTCNRLVGKADDGLGGCLHFEWILCRACARAVIQTAGRTIIPYIPTGN